MISFLSQCSIPNGIIFLYALFELVFLFYRRSLSDKNKDFSNCKRWECEGKWCYYRKSK